MHALIQNARAIFRMLLSFLFLVSHHNNKTKCIKKRGKEFWKKKKESCKYKKRGKITNVNNNNVVHRKQPIFFLVFLLYTFLLLANHKTACACIMLYTMCYFDWFCLVSFTHKKHSTSHNLGGS